MPIKMDEAEIREKLGELLLFYETSVKEDRSFMHSQSAWCAVGAIKMLKEVLGLEDHELFDDRTENGDFTSGRTEAVTLGEVQYHNVTHVESPEGVETTRQTILMLSMGEALFTRDLESLVVDEEGPIYDPQMMKIWKFPEKTTISKLKEAVNEIFGSFHRVTQEWESKINGR